MCLHSWTWWMRTGIYFPSFLLLYKKGMNESFFISHSAKGDPYNEEETPIIVSIYYTYLIIVLWFFSHLLGWVIHMLVRIVKLLHFTAALLVEWYIPTASRRVFTKIFEFWFSKIWFQNLWNLQMAFKIRSSKFRHIYGSIPKKDLCYENIKITRNTHDSNFCAVNPKFLAVVTETGGGGSFLCIPLKSVGDPWPLFGLNAWPLVVGSNNWMFVHKS